VRFWTVVLSVVLVVTMFAASGCGAIAKKAVEGATGVSVDEDDGSVTIKGEDGSESTIESGEGKLADNFPDNVPVYDGTIGDSTGFSSGGVDQWTASITTPDSIDDVKAFYVDELAQEGWTITFDMDSNDSSGDRTVAYSAESGNLSLTVTIGTGEDETEIAILVGTKPS